MPQDTTLPQEHKPMPSGCWNCVGKRKEGEKEEKGKRNRGRERGAIERVREEEERKDKGKV